MQYVFAIKHNVKLSVNGADFLGHPEFLGAKIPHPLLHRGYCVRRIIAPDWGWSINWNHGTLMTTHMEWRTPLVDPLQHTWTWDLGTSVINMVMSFFKKWKGIISLVHIHPFTHTNETHSLTHSTLPSSLTHSHINWYTHTPTHSLFSSNLGMLL